MHDHKKLYELVESRRDQLLEVCSDLIRIPSVNPPGDVEDIVSYIAKFLETHDIRCRVVRPVESAPNIIAELGDPSSGKKLILNGHCDVVPVGNLDKWDFDPFSGEIRDGKIHGRGASDMKCGLAGLLFAMGLLARTNHPDGRPR